MKKILVGVLIVVIGLVIAGIVYVKSIDFNQYKGMIAEKAEAATGRKLTLAGNVYLDIFTLTPSLAVDDVSFANAPWGSRPDMVKLKRLEAQVALIPLLSKQVNVKRFVLVSPDILLETDANGKGNWEFSAPAAAAAPPAPGKPAGGAPAPAQAAAGGAMPQVSISEVDIKDGTLTYRDGKTKQTTTIGLAKFAASAEGGSGPLTIDIAGDYNKAPFKAKGTLGALSEIQAPKAPFPINIEAEAGGATVKAIGTIAQPMAAKGIDLNLSVDGKTTADLAAFAPGVPAIGPYSLAGHVGDKDGNININQLKAALGKSDFAGDATWVKADKPTVRANLTSKVIDLAELQAAAGGAQPAATGGGESKPAAGAPAKPEAKTASSDGRLFSDQPLPVAGLKAANADVKLTAATVTTQGPILSNVNVALNLINGKLTINPFTADVVGGHIDDTTVLDASGAQPVLSLNTKAKDLDLAELMKEMKVNQKVTGKANFEGVATGQGQSVRAIMAGLDGHTDLSLGETHVDNSLMKIVMADLAKAVTGSGDSSRINCVVSHFDIAKGMATSKALVVDTESVTIQGSGTINLASEQINMHLDPSPKAAAVVDLAIPMNITGTLANPSVTPDAGALAKKLGGAAAGVATGGVAGGMLGGKVLGSILGDKKSDSGTAAAPSGNPCAITAAVPAAAPATAKGGQPAPTAPASGPAPSQEKSNPVEDIGKKLKGLF